MGAAAGKLDTEQCPLILDEISHICTEKCKVCKVLGGPGSTGKEPARKMQGFSSRSKNPMKYMHTRDTKEDILE